DKLLEVCERVRAAPARRVAVVDVHGAHVENDVARDATRDADRREALPVDETIDLDLVGPVRGEPLEHGGGGVDGVIAHPGARGVGATTAGRDVDADRAVASALDLAARGLAVDREIRLEQF